jgi:hypothetical protein
MQTERAGLRPRQRDSRPEDPIGIEAILKDPEPGGIAAISLHYLFAIIWAEQIGVATR